MPKIKAAGIAHETEPKDCYRAWVTDGHGEYRWSHRAFGNEMDARNYGFRWVFRFYALFDREEDEKDE